MSRSVSPRTAARHWRCDGADPVEQVEPELAFVDLNLVDGATGVEVGRALAARGITVVYMTANPAQLGNGVPGTIGVIPKPVDNNELRQAVEFAVAVRGRTENAVQPPRRLRLFGSAAGTPALA